MAMNDFHEKTVEDIMFENKHIIHERGFENFYEHTIRQFILPSGKIIDLFTYEIKNKILHFKIIELKRDSITEGSIFQIGRYILELIELTRGLFEKIEYKLIIVGSTINEPAIIILDLGIKIDFYIYKYEYDGINFKKLSAGMYPYFDVETTPSYAAVDFVKELRKPYGTMESLPDTSEIYDQGGQEL